MSYPLIKLYRLFRIIIVYRIDQLILPKNRCISPWLFWLYPFQTYKIKKLTPQERMVEAIVAMGPIFVKFAQILSSRFDMLPADIAQSLAQLQDKVPPFPFDEAKSILELHYKKPLSSIFSSFEKIPLGSASLAQVYGACLLDGSEVAVKILRPDIIQHVNKDLSLLRYIAERIDRYHPNRHLIRVMDVIESFEKSCHTECDLRNEAGNYSYMRTLFEGSNDLYIPKVYWQYSTANILIVERIYGIPVANQAQLLDTNIHVTKLARKNIEIFFKQVFEHNFFHGDLHPGNLFVDYSKTHDPMFIAVDFGIVGCLSKQDQYYLAENIISFLNRDYARVVDLHIESGWVAHDTSREDMICAIRAVGEPVYNRPLEEIQCAKLLGHLLQIARQHGMIVQPQLLLLQKNLLHAESLSRRLDPSINLWHIARPFMLQKSFKVPLTKSLYKLIDNIPEWLNHLANQPMHRSAQAEKPLAQVYATPPGKTRLKISGVILALIAIFAVIQYDFFF